MKRSVAPVRALGRVIRAPGFVLLLWLAQLLLAKLLAGPVRAAAQAGMRGHTWFDDGHRLRAVAELLVDEPAIMATLSSALSAGAIVAGLFSVVAAPAMLTRLAGERSAAAVLGAVGARLPAMLVQTGYGLVFRAICTGLAAIPATLLGAGGVPLVLLIASFPILVLDRARAAVVLEDERPYHPKTFLRALVHVGKRPLWWVSGTILEALKIGVGVVALLLVIQLGGGIWLARGAGLLAVALGLWRVALAVPDAQAPVRP
ncbi:MAG: hypothetical protein R6X02_05200 [Enhygromyxa sp.]